MTNHANYLLDLGLEIKLRALDARRNRDKAPEGSEERTFQSGRLIAFNEVVSMMQQQADGFGISLVEMQLDDVEPDRDLI